jgi:hypothetical protein
MRRANINTFLEICSNVKRRDNEIEFNQFTQSFRPQYVMGFTQPLTNEYRRQKERFRGVERGWRLSA